MWQKAWRDGSVDGQGRSDTDAAHHEPDLVDEAVGQDPPDVVLQYRVKDREGRHEGAEPDQQLGARERSGP